MAEWLRSGLQIRARRFDSGSGLQYPVWQRLPTVEKIPDFSYFEGDRWLSAIAFVCLKLRKMGA